MNSLFLLITSYVVAVPKSIIIDGVLYIETAAKILHKRSCPMDCGLGTFNFNE